MPKPTFNDVIEEICLRDRRFEKDAYAFVREGLDFTVKLLKKPAHGTPTQRHVSGPELLDGLRRFALEQFGPMTKTVLEHWGVRQCADFGEIVFNMVESGLFGKTENDSRNDFAGGYDFDEAFVKPFLPPLRPNTRCTRSTTPGGRSDRRRDKRSSPDPESLNSGSN
jgi:uncharacterized repeat protein (TIGR04138 family)